MAQQKCGDNSEQMDVEEMLTKVPDRHCFISGAIMETLQAAVIEFVHEPQLSITWFGAAGPEGRQNATGCWTAREWCQLPSRGLKQWFSNGDAHIPEGILGKEKYKQIEKMQIQKTTALQYQI